MYNHWRDSVCYKYVNRIVFVIKGEIDMNTVAGMGGFVSFAQFIGIIMIVIGVALIFLYIKWKRTIFKIDYAGGNIGFDLRFITEEESHEFQRVLRIYKDLDESNNQAVETIAQNVTTLNKASSVPEKIKEYNELYQQGILTKEEFETQKKRLLNSDSI